MYTSQSALKPAGSTRKWRKIRKAILQRDHHRCQYCQKRATHVDHIKPRKHGGLDGPRNLKSSCRKCNLAKGSRKVR